MMVIILVLIIYFLLVGFLTIFESKILGAMQNSVSVFKVCLFGLYNFYLDFMKVLIKGLLGKGGSRVFPYFLELILMIILMSMGFLVLLFSILFKNLFIEALLVFLGVDGLILMLKMFIFSKFSQSSYVVFSSHSMKNLYVFIEGVFSYLVFMLLFFLTSKAVMGGVVCKMVFLILVFICVLIKLFSTPFDYFESESELVGGGVLEFQGVGFLLWSLLEYGLMLNHSMFLVVLGGFLFGIKPIFLVLLFMILIMVVFFIRGVLISVSFKSSLEVLFKIFFMINLMMFLGLLL